MGKNSKFDLATFFGTLIEAAILRFSPEEVALNSGQHCPDTLYHHLNNKAKVEEIEKMLEASVSHRDIVILRRQLGNKRIWIAIDFTDEMFYGEKTTDGVVGTKRKSGSNYAFRYMTVNIVTPKGRFLIWAYPMFSRKETLWLLNRALEKIGKLGLTPHLILLDREFNSTDLLALIGEKYKYITPADQDEKFRRHIKGKELPAHCDDWRIANSIGEEISTRLVVLEEKKHKYGYLTNLPVGFFRENAYILSEFYSKRWGIETAHRCEDKFRISTTCKTAAVRYLYFVIGVLLYNLWVWLNFFFDFDTCGEHLTIAWMKRKLAEIFEEFRIFMKSPQRWFGFMVDEKIGGGVSACLLGQPSPPVAVACLPFISRQ